MRRSIQTGALGTQLFGAGHSSPPNNSGPQPTTNANDQLHRAGALSPTVNMITVRVIALPRTPFLGTWHRHCYFGEAEVWKRCGIQISIYTAYKPPPSVGGKLSRFLQHINYLDPPSWGPDTDIAAVGDKDEAEVWIPDQDDKVLGEAPMVETRLAIRCDTDYQNARFNQYRYWPLPAAYINHGLSN